MSEPEVEWVGTSCGEHGSYTFYKGFKLTVNGQTKKYLLGEFYFVRNSKDRPICIAELQLVWHDANTGNQLASARLYFRPEATPGGRQNSHGKDELLYTDEKVVIKCRDMMNLECDGTEWCYGMKAISELNLQEVHCTNTNGKEAAKYRLCKNIFKQREEKTIKEQAKIVILSFPAYCRYKSLVKKLSNGLVLSKMAIIAFGGVIRSNDCTWISFSRSSFHYPELDKFDFFSDNKAPVLKGRPRKKRTTKDLTCKVQERGGKYRRKIETISQDNVVGRPPLPESDSSDENQTDTSEDSTVGSHELPCPPKLVSSVNEVKEEKDEKIGLAETNQGVIRAVKQSSLVEVKPTAIPPVPKLVKIEPKPEAKVYESFRRPVPESTPVSVCCMENNIMTSSTKASVISSTYHADGAIQKSPYRPITMPTHENARIPHETQSEEAKTRTSSDVLLAASQTKDKLANVPVSVSSNNRTLLSHAGTISTNRHIQSRISAIVSTSKEKATRSLVATSPSELGTERHLECRNDLKQTFKRKRGRPPGKSTKYLKVQDMKLADQTPTRVNPLPQVEIDVSRVQVKTELITSLAEESIADDIQSSVEPEDVAEREFMTSLKNFMKKRGSPIEKIPALGFRKINLFKMFEVTRSLGGYDEVTAKRLWRRVYNEVGGAPSITSAATNSRKHYERLLLPFERFLKKQDPSMMVQKSGPTPISGEEMELTRRDQNANVVLQKEPRLIPQTQQNNPSKPAVSVSASVVYTSSDLKSSVEFVTSGSRGSPVLLYSSAVDQVPRKLASAKEITKNSHSVHCESRPRVIASVGELRPPKSEVKSEMRSYIAETLEDEPRLYMSQKSRKKEMRTAVAEYEFKHDYPAGLVHSDRVKDFRPRAQDSLHTNDYASHACTKNNTPEITHEQRDAHKNKVAHDLSDGVLMMSKGMAEEKVRRGNSHSPRQLDDGYISTFSVPVFQPSRFSPGVELYDLPNGGFPLRTSSRIFMPPSHQLFPSSSHPAAAMATYSPHIIATIGPEPGAVYPLHIPGFYPPELSFPVDAGVSVLRS